MSEPNESVDLFVPGRLCLFGEHSDWAAEFGLHRGFCLIVGTDQGLTATARPADNFVVESQIPDENGRPTGRARRMECHWDSDVLLSAAHDREEFFRYCAGVAHQMMQHPRSPGGLNLQITSMDLPLRKGVSSSAAVCILVARAFDAVYKLGLFPHELMELAYLGEKLTGSQCGRMDQACIYGKTPVLLTFAKADDIRVEPVSPGGEIPMFIVDLAGRKDTVRILGDLQGAYLTSRPLQEALGADNERIVRTAYRTVGAGDAEGLGKLMTEAQGTFDEKVAPHSTYELSSPLLHELLNDDVLAGHIYGGKGVGSQGDGTAQFVARSCEDRMAAMKHITETHETMQCFPLTIAPVAGDVTEPLTP
ncbi:MAG: GHMP kinase [Phycisphaerae bacterium]|nr:GHMP kinase [Phycisphaerae bacterium]